MQAKILVIPAWYPTEKRSYHGVFIQRQVEALSEKFDTAVYYPQPFGVTTILKRSTLPYKWNKHPELAYLRQPVYAPYQLPYRLYLKLFMLQAQRGFNQLVERWGKPDLIHAHVVLPAGYAALQFARQLKVPVVLTEHSSPARSHFDLPGRGVVAKEVFHSVDRLLCVSPTHAEQVSQFTGEGRCTVLPNVVDTDFFIPPPNLPRFEGKPFTFLAIGHLIPVKDYDTLLQAAAILAEDLRNKFALRIIGEGTEEARLKALSISLGLDGTVSFLGGFPAQDVLSHLQACDALVHSSRSETFGVVMAEAMSCGKPVVATRCGGSEYIVTPENGILVDKEDPAALAEGMRALMENISTYKPDAVRRSVVERFGRDAFIENISAVYGDLLSR